ncbi:AAA family ATPase [Dactylosporangium sp. NPDC050588]|uniref:AAA family ATPase n=1 Tax=Dactylosporangium sp. NPDC050588 TaxID=3157211 RepID=UPI0033CAD0CC
MWLQRLTLMNYKAFPQATIDFAPAGITLIAGANNSGKSSILAALDVVSGASLPSHARFRGAAEASVSARFGLTMDERVTMFEKSGTPAQFTGSPAFEWIEWTFTSNSPDDSIHRHISQLTTCWIDGSEQVIGYEHRSGPSSAQWDMVWMDGSTPVKHDGKPNLNHQSHPGGDRPPSFLEAGSGYGLPFQTLLHRWRTQYFHFPVHRPGIQRSEQLRADIRLAATGENLSAVLLGLNTNNPAKWLRLQELISTVVPEVGRLRLSTKDSSVQVVFDDEYSGALSHNLKDLGSGVEQLLLTLVLGMSQEQGSLIALEEPETSLHPGAQRALLGHLSEWAEERQFIITTHSPVLLDGLQRAAVKVVRRENGQSSIGSVDSPAVDALQELGVRLTDVLSAERILLVEGPSDRDVLQAWFPQLATDPRVAVILGVGGDNSRLAHILNEWVQKADRLGVRKVLFIRDRDELASNQIERLLSKGSVHVLNRRELENYLLDSQAISLTLPSKNGESIAPESIERFLREHANELRDRVVLKRVCARLGALVYVDHELRASLSSKGATAEELIDAVVERIPSRDQMAQDIRELWAEESRAVVESWDDEWASLAPGEELLVATWSEFSSGRFSKKRDGVRIARNMTTPPLEITSAISDFLGIAQ